MHLAFLLQLCLLFRTIPISRAQNARLCDAMDALLFDTCWTDTDVAHTATPVVDCICTSGLEESVRGEWAEFIDLSIDECIEYYSSVSPGRAAPYSRLFEGYCSSYYAELSLTTQTADETQLWDEPTRTEVLEPESTDPEFSEGPRISLPPECNSVLGRVYNCWTNTRIPMGADEVVTCACTPDDSGVAPSVHASRFNSIARGCVTYASGNFRLSAAFGGLESYCSPIVPSISVSLTWSPGGPTASYPSVTDVIEGSGYVEPTGLQNETTVGSSAGGSSSGFNHVLYLLMPLFVVLLLAL